MSTFIGAEVTYRLAFERDVKRSIVAAQEVTWDGTAVLVMENGDRIVRPPIRCRRAQPPRRPVC